MRYDKVENDDGDMDDDDDVNVDVNVDVDVDIDVDMNDVSLNVEPLSYLLADDTMCQEDEYLT